jgi:hypothetical protein
MKIINPTRFGASRLFNSRYAPGERPDYLIELVAFGVIVIAVALSLG